MHIEIRDHNNCCGCSACDSICPKDAIKMTENNLGFLYPTVDEKNCINCGLCTAVCQFHSNYKRFNNFDEPFVYGIRLKDLEQMQKSQSGGAGYILSESIINQGGIVYGAGYKSIYQIIHKRIDNKEDLQELRGSKYVQSDLTGVFRKVKEDLRNNKKVLFTGTPCQVEGLRSYIGEKLSNNLFTIDLVCHATPSPKVWKEYVKWIEKDSNQKVIKCNFRDKRFGWHIHLESFRFSNGERIECIFRDFFYKHLSVRKSCSICPYTNTKRVGDITIGDFWGWENYHREWNDNKGVSLLMINSEKGLELFNSVKDYIYIIKSHINECLQPQLHFPITLSPFQDLFIKDFNQKGINYVIRHQDRYDKKDNYLIRYLKKIRSKMGVWGLPFTYMKIFLKKLLSI